MCVLVLCCWNDVNLYIYILTGCNIALYLPYKKIILHVFISIVVFSMIFSGILSSQFKTDKAWASPDPVVIDFENLPANGPVFNQYANVGVIFFGSSMHDYSQSSGFAHSGVKAIDPCPPATEFCQSPIRMSFTAPQKHVKVWVGYSFPNTEQQLVVLRGFDSSGTQISESSVSLSPSTSPIPINIPLEVNTQNPIISSALVTIVSTPSAFTDALSIDDIEFDSTGPPPVCPTTDDPVLFLSHPVITDSSQFDSFLLEGTVSSNAPIDSANVTATSDTTGATNTVNLLSIFAGLHNGGSFATNMGGLLFPGSNTVTVKVQNCHSTTQISNKVVFNPITTGTRFNFLGMEVTQAIQDMDNKVPLIAGKRTFVRVYFNLTGPTTELHDVTGVLSAFKAPGALKGGEFIGSVTSLNTMPFLDSRSIVLKRGTFPFGSLNFEIPLGWTNSGQIHFTITPYIEGRPQGTTASLVPCEDTRLHPALMLSGCDNLHPASPPGNPIANLNYFNSVRPLNPHIIGIPYTEGGVTIVPRQVDFDHLWSWLRRAYPVSDVSGAEYTDLGTGYDGKPACWRVATDLFWRWINDIGYPSPANSYKVYIGLISDNGATSTPGLPDGRIGCTLKIPWPFNYYLPASAMIVGSYNFGWDFDGSYSDWVGGHEIAHTFQRGHPGFADTFDGECTRDDSRQDVEDDDYPYSHGFISGGNRHFGFDVGDHFSLPSPIPTNVKDPRNWTDVMTYRCNMWVSDYTYRGIMNKLSSSDFPFPVALFNTSSSNLYKLPLGAEEKNTTLFVLGSMNVNKSRVDLDPFTLYPGLKLTPRPANSSYSIDLLSSNGRLLAHYPFQPKIFTDGMPGYDQIAVIGEMVPYLPDVKQIVIAKNGETLGLRNVSANAPNIKLVFPNGNETLKSNGTLTVRWTSSDIDHDKLTYSLLYSINGGKDWQTISVGINKTYYRLNLADLPGSDLALFRVAVTDGVNTVSDDSDEPFRVISKAPEVRIITPGDNSRFSNMQTITLTGHALDLEDGLLDGRALTWSSDKQGKLGIGRSILVDGLSPGLHEITLTAKDKSGNVNASSIRLTIFPIPPVAVAGPDQQAKTGSTIHLNGNQSTGSGHISYQWAIISKPINSRATIIKSHSTEPLLVTDLKGTYVIQLFVKDDTGFGATDRMSVNTD
jgi:hypothetical protein